MTVHLTMYKKLCSQIKFFTCVVKLLILNKLDLIFCRKLRHTACLLRLFYCTSFRLKWTQKFRGHKQTPLALPGVRELNPIIYPGSLRGPALSHCYFLHIYRQNSFVNNLVSFLLRKQKSNFFSKIKCMQCFMSQ